MKIRNGFVSNSSSTAFILDSRDSKVKKILPKIRQMPSPDSLCRNTCGIIGQEVRDYAKYYINEGPLYDIKYDDDYFYSFLKKHIYKLGDNIVMVRISDEGLGGEIEDFGLTNEIIERLAIDKCEYH